MFPIGMKDEIQRLAKTGERREEIVILLRRE